MEATDETPVESGADSAQKRQVEMWSSRVKAAKRSDRIGKAFDRMREDMRFAEGLQWPDQKSLDDPRYVVNIVQRHIQQRTAALYAKNPKAVAHRRDTLDFREWDGDPQAISQAQQQMAQAQQVQEQAAAAGDIVTAEQASLQMMSARRILEDYQKGMQRREQLDRMAKTLEIIWQHQTGEQQPPFKASMKHLVRRALTTGIGFLKLGYHRFSEYRPEDVARVTDLTEQLATLKAKMAEMQDEDSQFDETSAEAAEVEQLLQKVTQEQEVFMREGLDFDFPRSTSIIPDPDCYQLDGFLGARWVAQEFLLTPGEIRAVYGKDIKTDYKHYDESGSELDKDVVNTMLDDGKTPDSRALVFEIYDKAQGQTFTVCDGCDYYLVEPKTPDVHLERFWPFFTLSFNTLESEDQLYPPSDVTLIHHQQTEMNISRQRLREHRDAARPGTVGPRGKLDETDKASLGNRQAHQHIELNIGENDDVRKVIQPIPLNPIDPNLYEVNTVQDDVYKTVGTQEAVLGGMSGATATEASIGESSRLSSISSAVDELDDFLTQVAKFSSHLLLAEMSPERAEEIAGRGAIWPQTTGAEIAKDLWLEIRAGSSGRPNKAAEIQNLERVMPFLMQIPGVPPQKVLEEVLTRLDDRLDPNDFYDATLPSMTAMNRQAEVGTGDPASDPNQQGDEGGDKTSVPQAVGNMGPRAPAEQRNMDPNRQT